MMRKEFRSEADGETCGSEAVDESDMSIIVTGSRFSRRVAVCGVWKPEYEGW